MKYKLTYSEKEQKLVLSSMKGDAAPNRTLPEMEGVASIDERVKLLLDIVKRKKRPSTNMLFFVMYDISDTSVRNQVSKYLLRKGCFRIQRSIFLADLPTGVYDEIPCYKILHHSVDFFHRAK